MTKPFYNGALAVLTASALIAMCFFISGCTLVGAGAYVLMGDAPVEAQYDLPRVATLVFVENYVNPDINVEDSDVFARYVLENLKKNLNKPVKKGKKPKVPPMVFIDPFKLYDLRTGDAAKFHHMKIHEIGRELGAKQVIYISMDSMGVQSMGNTEMMRGSGSVRVKVISCVTGLTLWPQESGEGFPVGFQSNIVTPQQNITYADARDRTMRAVAKSVAELFYKHNPADDPDDDDQFSPAY